MISLGSSTTVFTAFGSTVLVSGEDKHVVHGPGDNELKLLELCLNLCNGTHV